MKNLLSSGKIFPPGKYMFKVINTNTRLICSGAYLGPCQTPMMELFFVKLVNVSLRLIDV